MNDISELIENSESICVGVTPGPWLVDSVTGHDEFQDDDTVVSRGIDGPGGVGLNTGEEYQMYSVEDASFIAAARTLVPGLTCTLKMYHHWHEKTLELQGQSPGRTPSMVYSWIRNLKRELGEARAELARLKGKS